MTPTSNCERRTKLKCCDKAFDEVFHHLCGAHLHQVSLIRGEGLWEPQGCALDKGFRKFTSKKLESLTTQENNFMIHQGCFQQFTDTWVFIGNLKVSCNVAEMDYFVLLTFTTTTGEARRYFPRDNGTFSLGMLMHMVADYVILGKLQSDEVWDISRNGMVKNVRIQGVSQKLPVLERWEAHLQHVQVSNIILLLISGFY